MYTTISFEAKHVSCPSYTKMEYVWSMFGAASLSATFLSYWALLRAEHILHWRLADGRVKPVAVEKGKSHRTPALTNHPPLLHFHLANSPPLHSPPPSPLFSCRRCISTDLPLSPPHCPHLLQATASSPYAFLRFLLRSWLELARRWSTTDLEFVTLMASRQPASQPFSNPPH